VNLSWVHLFENDSLVAQWSLAVPFPLNSLWGTGTALRAAPVFTR
jgi:hypothetical protein